MPVVVKELMTIWICGCVCVLRETEKNVLTTLLRRFVRPVLAIFHIVAHLAAVNALPILATELFGAIALCNCGEHTI